MEENKIVEGNKAINKMVYKYYSNPYTLPSWDNIMIAVEHIENMPEVFMVTIEDEDCMIDFQSGSFKPGECPKPIVVTGNTKKEAVFQALAQFAEWHNTNKH